MTSYRSLSLVLYKRSKKKYNISPAALIFWTGTSILLEKAGKRDGDTKRRIDDSHDVLRGSFYLSHHGGRSFTGVQDDALLLVSLWCFPLPIVSNAFPQSSFRTGVGKWVSRTVTRSEESITLMTLCGFFSVYHKITFTVFLTTGTAPSHLFRMTSHLNRHLHN